MNTLRKRSTVRPAGFNSLLSLCVVLTSIFFAAYGPNTLGDEVSEEKLRLLKKNISKLDLWLDRANTEKSGLSKQLQKQEKAINSLSQKIRGTNAQITAETTSLRKLKAEEKKQLQSLNQQKSALIEQLRAIYFQGKQPAIKLLLDSDSPQNASRYLAYFDYINDAQSEKIDAFRATLKDLEKTEKSILRHTTQLNKKRDTLLGHKKELEKSQGERKRVLAKLNQNINTESKRLEKLKSDQKRLEQLLIEVEEAIANIPLPVDAKPFRTQKSKLPWPSRGKVIQGFGSRIAQGKLRTDGITIAAQDDKPVTAIHYGRVVFSDWLRGFGLISIIDHGDGYMSLYGQNKSLVKDTGDWVRPGDTIAYSGSSSDNYESGLYFAIRHNGKPLNPKHWLK